MSPRRDGQLYFVTELDALEAAVPMTAPIKIGFSSSPRKRLGELQTGNPRRLALIVVVDGVERELEGRLHAEFAADRLDGEWFQPTPRVIELVEYYRLLVEGAA